MLDDLVKTLDDLGIEPLGSDSVDSTAWTLSKVADPYGIGDLDLLEPESEVSPELEAVDPDMLIGDELNYVVLRRPSARNPGLLACHARAGG